MLPATLTVRLLTVITLDAPPVPAVNVPLISRLSMTVTLPPAVDEPTWIVLNAKAALVKFNVPLKMTVELVLVNVSRLVRFIVPPAVTTSLEVLKIVVLPFNTLKVPV